MARSAATQNDDARRRSLHCLAAWAVVITPAAAALLAVMRGRYVAPSRVDLALLAAFYALTMLGLTAGFHRCFTHGSFKAHPAIRIALAIAGSMAAQGPIVRWVAQHRRHHASADRPGDPHSPVGDGRGVGAWLGGFWHAHVGWMLEHQRTFARRFAPDLVADPQIRRLDRWYFAWLLASLGLPAALGGLLSGTVAGAWSGLLWGGLVRIFLVHQATWAVNSLGHGVGTRPFRVADRSTNNAVVALLTFGEGWHNNHHAFPSSAKHGMRWWQLDITAWFIHGLARLGLVSDIKSPGHGINIDKKRRTP